MENSNTKITYIYGLYEVGKEDEIRYVGKSDNPKIRLINHMYKSKYKSYKNNWIESVKKKNSKIGIKIIEVVNYDNWEEREKYWISEMRRLGYKLTNTTIGGEGAIIYEIRYEDCKKYLLDKNIKSKSEFYKWIKSKDYNIKIPKNPREVYLLRNEWISWGDFLSTNKIQNNKIKEQYLTYDNSKRWLKDNLKFENLTSKIYKNLAKEGKIPVFIPNRPNRFYEKRGWISWSDFLSNDNIIQNQKKLFISYEDCKKYAKDNNIKSLISWKKLKKPVNIPSVPSSSYKEWISWSEFLGVEIISDQDKSKMYMSYDECKKYIYENLHKINSKTQLREYILKNNIKNIPINPELSYKNKGWVSWDSFLSKNYLNFNDAKKIIKKLNIKSNKEWRIFIKDKDKIYKNIPNYPDKFYKNEWIDWCDWLGKDK